MKSLSTDRGSTGLGTSSKYKDDNATCTSIGPLASRRFCLSFGACQSGECALVTIYTTLNRKRRHNPDNPRREDGWAWQPI